MGQAVNNTIPALEALENCPMGVLILSPERKVVWANQAFINTHDTSMEALNGQSEMEVMAVNFSQDPKQPSLLQSQSGKEQRTFAMINHFTSDGFQCRYFADVSETVSLNKICNALKQQLKESLQRDDLTNLLNKRSLLQALSPEVSRSRRYNNPLSLLIIKVQEIKPLLDGVTVVTDQVISSVGHYLRDQMRWVDLIGRTDDDEFSLILPETQKDDAEKLAEKISDHLQSLALSIDSTVKVAVTVACGISGWQKGDDMNLMLERAASALEKAQDKPGAIIVN